MSSSKKNEKQKDFVSTGGVYVYEDPITRELFYYSRRGLHRKNGRLLIFKGKAHILDRAEQSYSDDKAGYPPNCNEGHHEEDGKCVPTLDKKEDK